MIIKIEPYKASLDVIEKRLTEMGRKSDVHNVIKKAINETAGAAKEILHSETKKMYTIKSSVFRKVDIKKRSTNSRHPGATLIIKGETIGVKEGYKSSRNGKRKGASVQIIKNSSMKEVKFMSGGHAYKAFISTITNEDGDGNVSEYTGIFQRVPGKYMKGHQPSGKSKGREAIKKIVSMSNAKAAEATYQKKGLHGVFQEELIFRMLKHMHAAIGDVG